jgi:hypothetical protein
VTKSEKAAATNKKYRIISLPLLPPKPRRETVSRCNLDLQQFPLLSRNRARPMLACGTFRRAAMSVSSPLCAAKRALRDCVMLAMCRMV